MEMKYKKILLLAAFLGVVVVFAAVLFVGRYRQQVKVGGEAAAGVIQGATNVVQAVHFDLSQPLRSIPVPQGKPTTRPADNGPIVPPPPPDAQHTSGPDPILQKGPPSSWLSVPVATAAFSFVGSSPNPTTPVLSMNFDGVSVHLQGLAAGSGIGMPPDPNGATGATQYVQYVNMIFGVFSKSTGYLLGNYSLNALWNNFDGVCGTSPIGGGDGIVLYDQLANRWVVSYTIPAESSTDNTGHACVAVSQTSDATGAYYRYDFTFAGVKIPDYPKMGIWPDAYYATFNIYPFSGVMSSTICAYDRNKMLTGAAASRQCFTPQGTYDYGFLPANLTGPNPPPRGSPSYILSINPWHPGILNLWKFHVNWTNSGLSTFTGPAPISVASWSNDMAIFNSIPQPGTNVLLESMDDRLMYPLTYRNFGDHESLVVNHTVDAGNQIAGIRWYEIRNPGSAPVIYQQSTYSPDTTQRWMGSMSMDKKRDIALGYSVSSQSVYPTMRYNIRPVSYSLNYMNWQEMPLVISPESQTATSRWGDYSGMSIDPVDDCTFWYTNEYMWTDSVNPVWWRTRIGSFYLPSCKS